MSKLDWQRNSVVSGNEMSEIKNKFNSLLQKVLGNQSKEVS